MVHFWKPWKHASWPPPECREPFSMLPRHALSSFIVWNAGVGPWWAATAEIFKGYGFKFHCLPTPAGPAMAQLFQNMPLTTFIIHKTSRANRLPKPCTLCSSHRIELFPAEFERIPGPPPPPPPPGLPS